MGHKVQMQKTETWATRSEHAIQEFFFIDGPYTFGVNEIE
jgi:hypothetical protein